MKIKQTCNKINRHKKALVLSVLFPFIPFKITDTDGHTFQNLDLP
jgi:hypothetical protein